MSMKLKVAVINMVEATTNLAIAACETSPAQAAEMAETMRKANEYAAANVKEYGQWNILNAAADMIVRCASDAT